MWYNNRVMVNKGGSVETKRTRIADAFLEFILTEIDVKQISRLEDVIVQLTQDLLPEKYQADVVCKLLEEQIGRKDLADSLREELW